MLEAAKARKERIDVDNDWTDLSKTRYEEVQPERGGKSMASRALLEKQVS